MNETQNLGLLRYFLVHSVGATGTSEACQRIAAQFPQELVTIAEKLGYLENKLVNFYLVPPKMFKFLIQSEGKMKGKVY